MTPRKLTFLGNHGLLLFLSFGLDVVVFFLRNNSVYYEDVMCVTHDLCVSLGTSSIGFYYVLLVDGQRMIGITMGTKD